MDHARSVAKVMNNEQLKRLLELRAQGHTVTEAANALGVSISTASRWINAYLRANPFGAAEEFRHSQLEDLNAMQERIMARVERTYVKVSGGTVVMVPLVDAQGLPVMEKNPKTGEMQVALTPLEDVGPQNEADALLLRLFERKSKLLGLDLPIDKGVRLPEEDPEKVAQIARQAALVKAVIKEMGITEMRRDPDVVDVPYTDVTPSPTPVQQSTTAPLDPIVTGPVQ